MKIIKASLQRSEGLLVATLLVIPLFVHFNVINRSLPMAALRFFCFTLLIKASLKIIKASMKIIKASLQRSEGLLVATLLVIPLFLHFNVINRSLPMAALRFYFSPYLCKQACIVRGKIKPGHIQTPVYGFGVEDGIRTHDTWNHNPVL
jgi:hypothetical protein